jgi:hypothetical protein
VDSKFRIIISSDDEYEDLCAEIYYEDQFIAILTQEQGFENLKIEFYPYQMGVNLVFKFAEFENALNSAKKTLQDMKKSSK